MSSPVVLAHEDVEQLLGAFVLHAVDADEFALIERHLESCPRCSSEVDDRNEIAAALGNAPADVPQQVWDRIARQLVPDSDATSAGAPSATVVRLDRAPGRTRRSGRGTGPVTSRRLLRLSVAGIAAAAAAIVALGVNLSSADGRLTQEQSAMAGLAAHVQLEAALASPGHRVVELRSGTDAQLAELVVSGGVGYAVASALPTLPADETYQLWANIGGQPVSLGLLGDRVEPGAAFSLRSERGRAVEVLVTVEPAGGVVVPDRAPIASGRVVV